MDLDPGPIGTPLPDISPRAAGRGVFEDLMARALRDLDGLPAALDAVARVALDGLNAQPDADLAPHEATMIESQRADRATLGQLYLTDELDTVDAAEHGEDDATRTVNDVANAHRALSGGIDEGASDFPDAPEAEEFRDRRFDPEDERRKTRERL